MTPNDPAPSLQELDEPALVLGGTSESVMRSRKPANFELMSPEQRDGWPQREFHRWLRKRGAWLLFPASVTVILAGLGHSWPNIVGAVGLSLDILGVWLLAEGLLLSNDDAGYLSTLGGLGNRHLLAHRDRLQARVALVIATLGFIGQIAPLIFS